MENLEFDLLKKARKDKQLNSVLFIYSKNESFMRLCVHERGKYSNGLEQVFIEIPVKFRLDGYSKNYDLNKLENLNRICFHESVYGYSHVTTILNAIKKDSVICCHVVAFNGCNNDEGQNIVRHKATIQVDEKIFLFSSYVGPDNLASPIRY
jgi:beta-mannanase